MSEASRPRRAVAEINWGGDPSAIMWVGNRTVHQYWPLLSGYFRDILLPPQRHAGTSAVAWTWREPGGSKPVSGSELAGVRKRLTADHQLFADNLTRGLNGDAVGGLKGQGNVDELGAALENAIARLVSSGDDDLAAFVCRTENGLRVHSWGAHAAARPTYPDGQSREIGGQVVSGGKPAAGREVVLENETAEQVARTQTDAGGSFRFQKIAAGEYRLRARSRTADAFFPSDGVSVTMKEDSVGGVLLREEDSESVAPPTRAPWPRRVAWGAFAALVIVAGVAWLSSRRSNAQPRVAQGSQRTSELNFSHARASKDGKGSVSRETSMNVEPHVVDVSVEPGDVDAAVENPSPASESNSGSTEKEIIQPASPLLPGQTAGSPMAPGAPVENVVQRASGESGAGGGANGAAAKASAVNRRNQASPSPSPEAVSASIDSRTPSERTAKRSALRRGEPEAIERPSNEKPFGEKTTTERSPATADLAPGRDPGTLKAADMSATGNAFAGNGVSGERATERVISDEVAPTIGDRVHTAEAEAALSATSDDRGMAHANRTWRVQTVSWQARQWHDAASSGAAAARGEAVEIPARIRSARIRSGLLFSMGEESTGLHWAQVTDQLSAAKHRAEFSFSALAEGGPTRGLLLSADDRVVAEVRWEGEEALLRVADGVRVHQWFAVEGDGAAQFVWRSASGGPLPRAVEEAGRVAIPLDGARANGVAQSLAAIDADSGWALTGQVRVEAVAELKP